MLIHTWLNLLMSNLTKLGKEWVNMGSYLYEDGWVMVDSYLEGDE